MARITRPLHYMSCSKTHYSGSLVPIHYNYSQILLKSQCQDNRSTSGQATSSAKQTFSDSSNKSSISGYSWQGKIPQRVWQGNLAGPRSSPKWGQHGEGLARVTKGDVNDSREHKNLEHSENAGKQDMAHQKDVAQHLLQQFMWAGHVGGPQLLKESSPGGFYLLHKNRHVISIR